MHQHIEKSKPTHDILLLSTVKNLKEQNNQKDLEIGQLKERNENKDKTLNELKRDFEDLRNLFHQMTKKIGTKEEETNHRLNKFIENQTQKSQNLIKDVDTLKRFSQTTSKLHLTLSKRLIRKNHYDSILFQADYEDDEEVKKWNEMVEDINNDKNDCNFLKSSINCYKETVYSRTYKERFSQFCFSAPLGTYWSYKLISVGCSNHTKSICVRNILKFDDFKKEVDKTDKRRTLKVHNHYGICSYYIGDCLHVLTSFINNSEIYLLHESNEDKKMYLPNGMEVIIDGLTKYKLLSSIVLYRVPYEK